MNTSLLAQLGFSDKEIAVYLTILKHGKISPAHVARVTKMKRTTAYSIAEELIKRGVVTTDPSSKAKYLLALPPQELHTIIEKEHKELEKREQLVEQAVEELKEITKEVRYSIPKITFITEEDLGAYLRKQTPLWNKSLEGTDGLWWGFQDSSFAEHYSDWIDWYWTHPSSKNYGVRILTLESDIEENLSEKGYNQRQVKFWSGGEAFSAATWVVGDYIVLIHTKTRPHYLIEICDAGMTANQRALFKGIWDLLP